MAESQVDKVANAIRRLVWNAILERVLARLLVAVPFLGWPIIKDLFVGALDKYLLMPIFEEAAEWGVFNAIDFKTEDEYNGYKSEANKLLVAQVGETWNDIDRKAFREAARELIVLHPRAA